MASSGVPTIKCPCGPAALIELRPRQGRPAALAADAAHHLGVRREERVDRGFGRVGEKAMAIDPDQEACRPRRRRGDPPRDRARPAVQSAPARRR